MSFSTRQPYAAFRLNLEQQKKRAKELLKSARSGDLKVMHRLQRQGCKAEPDSLQLARTQHCIARELRLPNWAVLKARIAEMHRTREALRSHQVLDSDYSTIPYAYEN